MKQMTNEKRKIHLIKLLVDFINLLQIGEQLTHDRAIR